MSERKVLYAVRMPVDLKLLLNSQAELLGMKTSQYVIMACYSALEAGKSKHTDAIDVAFDPCVVRPPKPSMDALRAICAGNTLKPEYVEEGLVSEVLPECGECGHRLVGKVIRGVVVAWACIDPGCAMYGREQHTPK